MKHFEKSHLLQMRGLKPLLCKNKVLHLYVASFTDAWIETSYLKTKDYETVSHLLQMRGLKHVREYTLLTVPCRIFYRCVD